LTLGLEIGMEIGSGAKLRSRFFASFRGFIQSYSDGLFVWHQPSQRSFLRASSNVNANKAYPSSICPAQPSTLKDALLVALKVSRVWML
jgi:hypothetical protein